MKTAMRYAPDHKERTHDVLVNEAAKAIRRDGPHNVAVAKVMKQAGLTHGGFYAHFRSRDAMVAAAIERMFETSRARWEKLTADRPPLEGLTAWVEFYLSPQHRDARDTGCSVAALASDLPRLSSKQRAAFSAGVERLYRRLSKHLAAIGHDEPAELASSLFAELMGALSLSRIETDPKRSDRILATSRRAVLARITSKGKSR